MNRINIDKVEEKLKLLADHFQSVLYEEDEIFIRGMKKLNVSDDEIKKYMHWEWPQGVGLFAFWNYYRDTGNKKHLKVLERYYARQIEVGFPEKNVNTVAPMLAMAYYAKEVGSSEYMDICFEWADFIMNGFPRTEEGGLQHITSDRANDQELWDDTLVMTVLFLAVMGKIHNREDYQKEAVYQFLLHTKYLQEPKTGLWYHGWTFNGRHNFSEAFWARGNCWITVGISELLALDICTDEVRRFLTGLFVNQVESLKKYQAKNGMWHTLVDDENSYLEASATAGFGYGIIKAVNIGLIDRSYISLITKSVDSILACVTDEGAVSQVSYGTPMGRQSKDFYKKIPIQSMPYGQALAMLFLLECQNTSWEGENEEILASSY